MRKVYIMRENEEDGALVEALLAQGLEPDENAIENPKCPVCGADTLLAYSEGESFEVLTWYELMDDDGANADAWYLVCSECTCRYEEQVERVTDPMGAEVFDLNQSHYSLDESVGLISRGLHAMAELIDFMQGAVLDRPSRKLTYYLDEARWRYDDMLEQVQQWLVKVPSGRHIWFDLDGERREATFVAGTEEGMLIITQPGDEMLAIPATSLDSYGPPDFHREDKPEPKISLRDVDRDRWIMFDGSWEMVVIRGVHVRLGHVDRLGLFHVRCWEPAPAIALGLEQRSENYWEGTFRRAEIEARYDVKPMIKVRGHWVEVWGRSSGSGHPAVRTDDPEIAAALSLEPVHAWGEHDKPEHERTIDHWSGTVPKDQVEDQKEIHIYQWPTPDHVE